MSRLPDSREARGVPVAAGEANATGEAAAGGSEPVEAAAPPSLFDAPPNAAGAPRMLSRRTLITGGAGIAVLLALGGASRAFAAGDDLLHPPGGQNYRLFAGACIHCDRCRSACPQGAIGVVHLEESLVLARSPKMNFRLGYCDYCEGREGYRCVESCPTGALTAGFDPAVDKIGLAAVDTSECLLYRTGGASCSRECISACRYDAVSVLDSGALSVDAALCNGCGACEYRCPSTTFASYTGSNRRGINVEPYHEET